MLTLIEVNAWGVPGTDERTVRELCVSRLRSELFAWYASRRSLGDPVSEMLDFSLKMVEEWHVKGAECLAIPRFTRVLIDTYVVHLPTPDKYSRGCSSLIKCLDLMKDHPDVFPPAAHQETSC